MSSSEHTHCSHCLRSYHAQVKKSEEEDEILLTAIPLKKTPKRTEPKAIPKRVTEKFDVDERDKKAMDEAILMFKDLIGFPSNVSLTEPLMAATLIAAHKDLVETKEKFEKEKKKVEELNQCCNELARKVHDLREQLRRCELFAEKEGVTICLQSGTI